VDVEGSNPFSRSKIQGARSSVVPGLASGSQHNGGTNGVNADVQ